MAMPPAGPAGVFISYRRDDTAWPVGWLHDSLVTRLGPGRVCKDVSSIQPGEDYVTAITAALGTCHTLLAVIGPGWLADPDGRRLLEAPGISSAGRSRPRQHDGPA